MSAPRPDARDPVAGQPRVQYLRSLITSPLIDVGAYSYYDDPVAPQRFQETNVLYHYGPERLVIGPVVASSAERLSCRRMSMRRSLPSRHRIESGIAEWLDERASARNGLPLSPSARGSHEAH